MGGYLEQNIDGQKSFIRSDTVLVGPNPTGAVRTARVNFGGTLPSVPTVVATCKNGDPVNVYAVSVQNVDETGFDYVLYRVDGDHKWYTDLHLDFIAVP